MGFTQWILLTDTQVGIHEANLSNISCLDGNQWIWNHFEQCVTCPVQFVGFVVGFVSLVLWLIPLFPQIYENYKRGSCEEALSLYFLLFWIAGDTCNLTGALLAHQLPSQQIIGIYYILQDAMLLGQYVYYHFKNNWKRDFEKDLGPRTVGNNGQILHAVLAVSTFGLFYQAGNLAIGHKSSPYAIEGSPVGRKLMELHNPSGHHQLKAYFTGPTEEIGYILGAVSAVSYFCGRVPQLYKNFKRQSTEGVSVAMFVIIVFANLTYGLSVILSGIGLITYGEYVIKHLPWLAGSLGCCFCDMIVLAQCHYYSKKNSEKSRDGFLNDADTDPIIVEVDDPDKTGSINYDPELVA